MSKFQITLLAIFVVCAVIGVAVFATSSSNSSSQLVPITIWGTLPASDMNQAISDIETANKNIFQASYTYIDPADFESTLVDAVATGKGPDIALIPSELFLSVRNLLYPIPYASYSQAAFDSSFVQAGDMFLSPNGIYAFPVGVDPMVMFWNRDMLSTAGIALPPKTWTDVIAMAPKLTTKDGNGNIIQSTLAFGEWDNVPYAKNILATLMFQGGTPIDSADPSTGALSSDLSERNSQGISGAEEAVKFFTQFADPSQDLYSWNRSEPMADSAFLAGDVAFYFAPASQTVALRARNPNLNFAVAEMPQTGTTAAVTYGDVYAFGILKSSANINADLSDINLLTGDTAAADISAAAGIAPSRLDLLAETPSQDYQATEWQGALISRGFLDPDSNATNNLFQGMVESVTSDTKDVTDAVSSADQNLGVLLRQVSPISQ